MELEYGGKYWGYGFSEDDITTSSVIKCFVESKKGRTAELYVKNMLEINEIPPCGIMEKHIKKMEKMFPEWAEKQTSYYNCHRKSDFIRNIINEGEGFDVVESVEGFIVFMPVPFVECDDAKVAQRCEAVRNKADFMNLVRKYFPFDEIGFGDVRICSDSCSFKLLNPTYL